jgi:hypothetical protein
VSYLRPPSITANLRRRSGGVSVANMALPTVFAKRTQFSVDALITAAVVTRRRNPVFIRVRTPTRHVERTFDPRRQKSACHALARAKGLARRGSKKSTRFALVGYRLAVAQLRAARALIRWSALDLAKASKVGVATIRRVEVVDGEIPVTLANEAALRQALEAAGIEFIDENGGGPGVRLRKPVGGKSGQGKD